MRKVILLSLFCLFSMMKNSSAKYGVSAQGSFMYFFGETKLTHFGGGIKGEYEYNERTTFYLGGNLYSKNDYIGIVEAQAFATPDFVEIPVPSAVYFMQAVVGSRIYFYGELEPVIKGDFGLYGIGELSLLIGTSESEVDPGPEYDLYEITETGTVKGSFWNYTASAGLGFEKQIGLPFIYLESKFNARLDVANAFSVLTRIPFGLSHFIGLRVPINSYD